MNNLNNVESLGGEAWKWKQLFISRNAYEVTEVYITKWQQRNYTFLGLVDLLVNPGSRILEAGCGPGRHAISLVNMGYSVVGIDIDPEIMGQAQRNAERLVPNKDISFQLKDLNKIHLEFQRDEFAAITHGGLMEHYHSAQEIRYALQKQLMIAPYIVFDVPYQTDKNCGLFDRENDQLFGGDGVFRQLWDKDKWSEVLAEFKPLIIREDHTDPGMTDDLVIVLKRRES